MNLGGVRAPKPFERFTSIQLGASAVITPQAHRCVCKSCRGQREVLQDYALIWRWAGFFFAIVLAWAIWRWRS